MKESGEQHQMRVYREAVARLGLDSKAHTPQNGEVLAPRPTNRENHLNNLKILYGRWHGTLFIKGQPRLSPKSPAQGKA